MPRFGDLFVQNDLAWTLEQIKENERDGFYKGKIAGLLIEQVSSLGGYITLEDLERYQPVEREPIIGTYRGYEVVSMPPPSSGGVALVELLNILENYNLSDDDFGSSQYIHHLVEVMKYTYANRTYHLGDSDFYPVPKEQLISKEYAKTIFERIESTKNKAVPPSEIISLEVERVYESTETTHYSIYDSYGNAVSTTTTINSSLGSGIVVEGAGFLLNNEMAQDVVLSEIEQRFHTEREDIGELVLLQGRVALGQSKAAVDDATTDALAQAESPWAMVNACPPRRRARGCRPCTHVCRAIGSCSIVIARRAGRPRCPGRSPRPRWW